MSLTVRAADTALYCFLLRGSIFFFAIALLSCVDIVAKKQGVPHLAEERRSRLNWRHEFQNDCADRCGLMLAGRTGQTIRTLKSIWSFYS